MKASETLLTPATNVAHLSEFIAYQCAGWISRSRINQGCEVNTYIAHFFDELEHVRRSVRLEGASDERALAEAMMFDHAHVLEVWEGDRCVWRIEPSLRNAA